MNQTSLQSLSAALLLLTALPAHAQGKDQDTPPRVTRAVVYPDRALVTRAVDLPCGTTPAPALFRGLPAGLDPTTLKAAAQGAGARVEGVSLYERVLQEAQSEQVRALDAQLEALAIKVRDQQLARERAQATRAQAESLRNSALPFLVREAAAEKKPNTSTWAVALDSARDLIAAAEARRQAADVALRDLQLQIQEATERRDAISSAAPRRVSDAEVLVRCATAGTAKVELSYMAGGVRWEPLYEARAQEAKGTIELSVLATLTQATGEPWRGVEVTLSTATTRRDATPPEPQRLYLGATPEDAQKKVLVRRDEAVSHVSAVTRSTGEDQPAGPEVADQGLSVQLRVPGTVDFAGDGRPARVLVETLTLPATFRYLTIPKMLPHVFREGQALNRARYPLIPGRVDLFSAGGFIGSTPLPLVAKGDKIKLAFGIDEQLKVRRVVIEELKKDPGFLGSTRRLTYAYRVEATSYAPKAVELYLQEHLPVSQIDDVKVLVDPKTTAGYEHEKADGILTWKLALKPKVKTEVELRFAVEIPSKYDSSGL